MSVKCPMYYLKEYRKERTKQDIKVKMLMSVKCKLNV